MAEVLSGPESNLTARYRSNGLSLSSSAPNTDGEDDPRTHGGAIAVHNLTSILCVQTLIGWDLHDKEVIACDRVRFVQARRQRAALSSAYGGFEAWSKSGSELPPVQVAAVPQFSLAMPRYTSRSRPTPQFADKGVESKGSRRRVRQISQLTEFLVPFDEIRGKQWSRR
jgi:hypothetical protein